MGGDSLNGGSGVDIASYWFMATQGLTISLTAPGLNTHEAAGDTYTSIEGLEGTDFADVLYGDDGGNIFIGRDGDDTFYYDSIKTYGGADIITDFTAGAGSDDVITYWAGLSYDEFSELMTITTQVNADTVIDFGGGNTLTLIGVNKADLHADDFATWV